MKEHKRRSVWSIFFKPIKIIGIIVLILAVLCGVAGGGIYFKYRDTIHACREKADEIIAQTERKDFSKPTDTRIYDSEGTLIGTINSGHYEYASISDISQNLQNAYIAQEDRRFLEHNGIDYIGLFRAGIALVKNKGEITQGGSTITQQIIKNTYLTQERSFERKITEFFAAPQMEKLYSKDDIMEFYCNTNFFANRCYGVVKASRYYFDKAAGELTIWEAATLVGISNNPSRYDPVVNPEASRKKRNQVIDSMEACGMITSVESRNAKAQPLTVLQIYEPSTGENYQSSYAIYCAALELMRNDDFTFQYVFSDKKAYETYKDLYQEAYQEKSDLIRNGGFEIRTSLDSGHQVILQDSVDKELAGFKETQENGKFALQGSAVSIDNKTGYVTAIVGGRGTEDEYNRGYLSKRQPGSTIKPLIDYAPAFETGFYYPSRLVDDHLFEGGPKNSNNKYRGEVSVREALNRSINTVAWQVLEEIGVKTGMEYLGDMHFTGLSYQDNGNASMSIGGFTEGASVVNMARGYSVLANGGWYSNKTCIISINSQHEGELYQGNWMDERVFTEDTSYMVTDILKGTMDKPYGTGYGLGLDIPSAGKTGTTNSNKDTWFCGYTKSFTTAVWVGYDTPKAMPGVYGKTYAGEIWQDYMSQIQEGYPEEDWEMPSTVSLRYVDSRGEMTDRTTGQQDLFSSVLEERAKVDSEKWDEAQKLKADQAKREQAWRDAAESGGQTTGDAVAQAAAQFQAAIADLSSLTYKDGGTQAKIDHAAALLGTLSGTAEYGAYQQQYQAAVGHVGTLSDKVEESTIPREIGPGVGPGISPGNQPETGVGPGAETGVSPEASPGVNPGESSGANQGVSPGANPGVNPGVNPGTSPGTSQGANPGTSPGVNPGAEPGGTQIGPG